MQTYALCREMSGMQSLTVYIFMVIMSLVVRKNVKILTNVQLKLMVVIQNTTVIMSIRGFVVVLLSTPHTHTTVTVQMDGT